jgi:hypothetical protein
MAERATVPHPTAEDIRPTLNLDSKRAARAKAKKKGPVVTFGGKRYELPPALPLEAVRIIGSLTAGSMTALDDLLAWALGDQRPREDVKDEKGKVVDTKIVGPDPRFEGLDLDDAKDLFDFIAEEYGIELGNSQASTDS